MRYVDGQQSNSIPLDDRGFSYGDGLFETIAVQNGIPQHWDLHLARMASGAARLGIPFPPVQLWQQELALAASHRPDSRQVAKLTLTRGSGGRGYAPPAHPQPRRIVQTWPWPEWPSSHGDHGVEVCLCSTLLAGNPGLGGIKHLNRLEQVLGSREVGAAGTDEGLMFDAQDHLIEATRSNVFLVQQGALITPDLTACGIAGVMRKVIMDLARAMELIVTEAAIPRAALFDAEEVMLCNSLIGVWPVRRITGNPGASFKESTVTRELQNALRARNLLP